MTTAAAVKVADLKAYVFEDGELAKKSSRGGGGGALEPLDFLTFCVWKPPQTVVKTTFPKHHFRIIADTIYFRDNSPCIDNFAKHCISLSFSFSCVRNYPQLVISSQAALVCSVAAFRACQCHGTHHTSQYHNITTSPDPLCISYKLQRKLHRLVIAVSDLTEHCTVFHFPPPPCVRMSQA